MNDPFLGMILQFASNFAPVGWALCDGQLLQISQNQSLYSILGTTYGGDGRTTFALPDLRGRVAMHPGKGPGTSAYELGQKFGVEYYLMTENQMPSHNHSANNVTAKLGIDPNSTNRKSPANAFPAPVDANSALGHVNIYHLQKTSNAEGIADGAEVTLANTGGGQYVYINEPTLCVNYIIALQGQFPSRN